MFIHGLGGKRYGHRATWGDFPRYLFQDFPNLDVALVQYRTALGRVQFWKSIDLADEGIVLADAIRDLAEYKNVIIIAHSMGGLLTGAAIRYLLNTNQKEIGRASCRERV